MQSLRLLQELNTHSTMTSSSSNIRRQQQQSILIDGEESFPIHVQVFPSTSTNSSTGMMMVAIPPEAKENCTNNNDVIVQLGEVSNNENVVEKLAEKEEEKAMEITLLTADEKEKRIKPKDEHEAKSVEKEEESKKEEDRKPDDVEQMLEDNDEDGEDELMSPEEWARWRRRALFPTETINEVCMFLPFAECAQNYTVCRMFHELLEPRRKICMEVFIKRLDAARERLDQTIQANLKEVSERREAVHQLTEHIGVINARLEEMGNNLAHLDAQIVDNHAKLDALNVRIERMRAPMRKFEKEDEEEE